MYEWLTDSVTEIEWRGKKWSRSCIDTYIHTIHPYIHAYLGIFYVYVRCKRKTEPTWNFLLESSFHIHTYIHTYIRIHTHTCIVSMYVPTPKVGHKFLTAHYWEKTIHLPYGQLRMGRLVKAVDEQSANHKYMESKWDNKARINHGVIHQYTSTSDMHADTLSEGIPCFLISYHCFRHRSHLHRIHESAHLSRFCNLTSSASMYKDFELL
jgi:hypothetical protein